MVFVAYGIISLMTLATCILFHYPWSWKLPIMNTLIYIISDYAFD